MVDPLTINQWVYKPYMPGGEKSCVKLHPLTVESMITVDRSTLNHWVQGSSPWWVTRSGISLARLLQRGIFLDLLRALPMSLTLSCDHNAARVGRVGRLLKGYRERLH